MSVRLGKQFGQITVAIFETLDRNFHSVEHRYEQVRKRCFVFVELEVTAMSQAQVVAACQNQRVVSRYMRDTGAAAIQDHRIVQKCTIAFLNRIQTI